MYGEKNNILATIENCLDVFINAIVILASYMLSLAICGPDVHIASYQSLFSIFAVLLFSVFLYQVFDLYRPIPRFSGSYYVLPVLKANITLFGLTLAVILLALEGEERIFAISWLAFSAVFSTTALLFKKSVTVAAARAMRKRDYKVRKVIIVGDNVDSSNDFVKQIVGSSEHGMIVLGAVGRKMRTNSLCDYLGSFEELEGVLDEYKPDDVVFAIDAYDKEKLISLVNMCDDRCIKVYFLPVIYGFFKSAKQIERVGSVPIINVHSTPLDNRANAFLKRAVDIIGSLLLIILTSPVMLITAIGVRITSPGPVFFCQQRVGKMGKPFKMIKFRSMRVNLGAHDTWTTDDDSRKTRFGSFLRRSSIDELPQLFNVLLGSMSLVGPRPEVPHFVEYFKNVVPLYMVKHYVKPGITGLAQIRGLRGDTSVEERIQADISYIENWSFFGDLAILLKTPIKAYNTSEKFVESEINDEKTDSNIVFEFGKMKAEIVCSHKPSENISEAEIAELVSGSQRGKKILYAASTMLHINYFHTDYINKLRDMGNTVKVMASGKGADFDIPFEKRILSPKNLVCVRKIKQILKEEKFDVLVLNTSLAAFCIRLACPKKERPKVVNFVHGYLFSENVNFLKAKLLFLCEKHLSGRTDEIITMNMQDYRTAIRNNLCRDKVYLVRGMGASVRMVQTEPKKIRRAYSSADSFVMCAVGELSARKNHAFLIRSMKRLLELVPNAVLWLVGDGAKREELKALVGELGLEGKVYLMGARTDACDFMRAADICVSSSSIEGMPFSLIEALGCGRTVLASMVKGHSDLIENGVDGVLYSFNNTEDFITKVYKIYTKTINITDENKHSKYEKYRKENVFSDTFSVLTKTLE